MLFDRVTIAKPTSSRNSSIESFVVCQGFKGVEIGRDVNGEPPLPGGYVTAPTTPATTSFVSCGSLPPSYSSLLPSDQCGFLDADRSYDVGGKGHLEPVQGPIRPPYYTWRREGKTDGKGG